jgi:protein-S-isoprenylcysteine O-methyltransferase Ste14
MVLGRSFGLLPAQRGLVVVGPYRFVRHPIYFGYLIGHIGFLLVNFSWRNASGAGLAVRCASGSYPARRHLGANTQHPVPIPPMPNTP